MQFFLTLKKNPWFQVGCKVYIQIKYYVYVFIIIFMVTCSCVTTTNLPTEGTEPIHSQKCCSCNLFSNSAHISLHCIIHLEKEKSSELSPHPEYNLEPFIHAFQKGAKKQQNCHVGSNP